MSVNVTFAGTTFPLPNTAGESGWASLTDYLVSIATNAATQGALKQAVRVALTTPVTIAVTDATVITNLTTPGAVAVTLPTGVTKQIFIVVDGKGDAGTNAVTLTGSGGQLINGAATYVIGANNGGAVLQFNGTGWTVLAAFYGSAPTFTSITVTTLAVSGTATIGTVTATNATVGGVAVTTASNTQTLTNKSISGATNTLSAIPTTAIADGALPAGVTVASANIVDGSIVNADVNASAAIAVSKLAAVTASRALVSDVSGFVSPSSVTTTELGYVAGVTSAIQTQITSNLSTLTTHTGASTGVHGIAGAVVGTTDTQTLTNKTLTSPVINTPTGIVKGDVGLGNVDNTSDATKNAATATLTNKTLTTPVIASISNGGTVTVPSGTDTLVNLAGTQTLTNKTINATNNTVTNVSLTAGVTGTLPVANGGTNLTAIGTALQVLRVNAGATALEYAAAAGDVSGPASATTNAVAKFSGTTGKIIQNSGVIIDASNNVTGIAALTPTGKVTSQSGSAASVVNGGTFDTLTAAQIPQSSSFLLQIWADVSGTGESAVYLVIRAAAGAPGVRAVYQSGVTAGIGGGNQVQITNGAGATRSFFWSAIQVG